MAFKLIRNVALIIATVVAISANADTPLNPITKPTGTVYSRDGSVRVDGGGSTTQGNMRVQQAPYKSKSGSGSASPNRTCRRGYHNQKPSTVCTEEDGTVVVKDDGDAKFSVVEQGKPVKDKSNSGGPRHTSR